MRTSISNAVVEVHLISLIYLKYLSFNSMIDFYKQFKILSRKFIFLIWISRVIFLFCVTVFWTSPRFIQSKQRGIQKIFELKNNLE